MADISKITIDAVEYDIKDATARSLISELGNSGSNADMLDGMHASEFATVGHTHDEATTSEGGFMSKTDKSALDNLKTLVGTTSVADQITNAITNKAEKEHTHSMSDLSGTLTISKGGIGASDGATGLKNLLAAGNTILSSYQYGDELPRTSEATLGRIFFVKA